MVLVTVAAVIVPNLASYSGVAGMANTTMYTTVSASYNALSLWAIVPMVLIAAVIIALIVGAFRLFAASGAAE